VTYFYFLIFFNNTEKLQAFFLKKTPKINAPDQYFRAPYINGDTIGALKRKYFSNKMLINRQDYLFSLELAQKHS